MTAPRDLEQGLALLRRTFDQEFARAPVTTDEANDDMLAVRVSGAPYALRLREITGLVATRKIVPLPSRRPDVLGVAGNRGTLVVVYSLAVLLGHGEGSKPPAWIVLANASEPLGLAFGELEGFWRVKASDRHAAEPGETAERETPHVREVVRSSTGARPVIDIGSTLRALGVHAGGPGKGKES